MVKIKVIDGIPCILLSDETDEKKSEKKVVSEHFSVLNDFTRIQRSKENECMKDLKEKFKNKYK